MLIGQIIQTMLILTKDQWDKISEKLETIDDQTLKDWAINYVNTNYEFALNIYNRPDKYIKQYVKQENNHDIALSNILNKNPKLYTQCIKYKHDNEFNILLNKVEGKNNFESIITKWIENKEKEDVIRS